MNTPRIFSVILEHRVVYDEDQSTTRVVVLQGCTDAKDAANEACLYYIAKNGGAASPLFVVEGQPRIMASDAFTWFDAEEYDETITWGARIICASEVTPLKPLK